jgi:hypothetical protein
VRNPSGLKIKGGTPKIFEKLSRKLQLKMSRRHRFLICCAYIVVFYLEIVFEIVLPLKE